MKKERIELRLSKEQKQEILDNARKNDMTISKYLLNCAYANMYGNNTLVQSDKINKITECLMDLNDIASEVNDERSIRLLERLGDLECLI